MTENDLKLYDLLRTAQKSCGDLMIELRQRSMLDPVEDDIAKIRDGYTAVMEHIFSTVGQSTQ